MALTPSIRSPQARVFSVARGGHALSGYQARVLVPVNYPTDFIRSQQARIMSVVEKAAEVQAQQARVLAVVKGRVANPYVAAWTFTLDGHDYYVLNLQDETLVYDFYAEHWYCWGTGSFRYWLSEIGISWNANLGTIVKNIGGSVNLSNVLVGDQLGGLHFLDPEKSEDDVTGRDSATPFKREIYGQLASRGRETVSCTGVELYSSAGHTRDDATNLTVLLETSDDQGASYDAHELLEAPATEYNIRLDWLSLGSITAPGRIFRITDFGALVRVDAMEMPSGE